jgi:hypothetical protein
MWTGDEFWRLGLRCELVMSSWDLDWDVNWWWVLETWIEMWTVDEFHYHPSLTYPKHLVHLENVKEHFCLWNQEHKEWGGGGGVMMGAEARGGAMELPSFLGKGSDMPSFLSYPIKDLVGWGLAPCVWGSKCVIISTSCCAEWGQRKGAVSLGWSAENGTHTRSDYKETSILDRLSSYRWLQESPSPVLNL